MSNRMRLAVLGAGGRMGRAVIALALADSRFELLAAQSRAGSDYIGQDAAVLAARPACGVLVTDALDDAIAAADVIIDFTRPEVTLTAAASCARLGKALVSGTTGLNVEQREELAGAATRAPILWAPNMSIGVNLLLAALADVAAKLGDEYDAEIVESHHRHKLDAPSGTAIALGETLANARGGKFDELVDFGRHGIGEARQPGRIGMHSLRAGEIVGEHDVRLVSSGEEIRFGHRAFSRDAFAAGALRAAAWLCGRAAGLYDMSDLLDLPRGAD